MIVVDIMSASPLMSRPEGVWEMSKSEVAGRFQDSGSANAGVSRKRKAYQPPRLRVFGSVAKLTGTKSGSGTDGTMQMTCL